MPNQSNMEDGKTMSEAAMRDTLATDPLSFAIVTDTHIDPYVPERSEDLKAVYDHLLKHPNRQPDFLFHTGDLVECGFPHEYETFISLIPSDLQDRFYVTRGNHEVRWDEWAGENFNKLFGNGQYSFDMGGIHFIALDPTEPLKEPGYFTREDLQWLHNDLQQLERETPVIIFLHHPIGHDNYFISNQAQLLKVIEPFNVRAVFSGHVHREEKWEQNGITFFSMPAIKNGPYFFWVEKTWDALGQPNLSIYSGAINKDRDDDVTWIAEISLLEDRPAQREKPVFVDVMTNPEEPFEVTLTVELSADNRATRVCYRFSPDAWAQKDQGPWHHLSPSKENSRKWQTAIDLTKSVPGIYQLQVRVINEQNQFWDESCQLIVPEKNGLNRLMEIAHVEAPIHAGMLSIENEHDEPLLIVATTKGRLLALTPDGKERWSVETNGAILGTPQYDSVHEYIVVGTTTRHVYVLHAQTGQIIWSKLINGAIYATPVIKEEAVILCAGKCVVSLQIVSGDLQLSTELGGFSTGMPAVDDRTVYVGAGDGRVYALDRRTGNILWEKLLTIKERPFRTLIYSAWATKTALVPTVHKKPPIVIFSSVEATYGLHQRTGEVIWSSDISNPFSKPIFHMGEQEMMAILVDDWGDIAAINPYTGKVFWKITGRQRFFNTSARIYKDRIYVIGVNGLLMGIHLLTGQVVDQYHISTKYIYSTPVRINDHLYIGDQAGRIRKIKLM